MIPETSRELHLNLSDQSRLRSSLSHTCLTALNTQCVHKACACAVTGVTPATNHHRLTLALPEWPRSAAVLFLYVIGVAAERSWENFLISKLFYFTYTHECSMADPRADGGICHPVSLDELFPPSHGCSSHTWLLEDFPGYNFNRFRLGVILGCNKMWQTYVLLVLFFFFFFRDTCGSLWIKEANMQLTRRK